MAKKKKNRVPKKIGGLKVPKFIRKSSLLSTLLASPLGRDILANAITAAAGAAAAVIIQDREQIADAAKQGLQKGGKVAGTITEAVKSAANAAMDTVADAARSVLPAEAEAKSTKNAHKGASRH
jgi:Pyruvate/2-oxoacid:ferredoxin oxidoreductase gamma subunit